MALLTDKDWIRHRREHLRLAERRRAHLEPNEQEAAKAWVGAGSSG